MTETEQKWKDRIKELEDQIHGARQEITMIQQSCDHNEYYIGYYSWRIGAMNVTRICNICGLPLTNDPATSDEYDQFMEEDNQGQGKKIYSNIDKDI